ncbi:MAG: hypothetical protein K0R84_787 [Clostridia bacterium]|jgi:O-antigen ligase|nr:hypothetical protein [Clostridia bacterium]
MNSNHTFSNQKRSTNKDQLKRVVFLVLISLTILQQMPIIKDVFYNQIRVGLYFGFGLFSIISIFSVSQFFKVHFIRYFILTISYTFILGIFINIYGGEGTALFELIVPFGILICSLNTNFDEKQLNIILSWYIIISAILGVSSIFYYGEGFTITRNYFLVGKNQVGPLLGISTVIIGIWILDKKQFNTRHNYILLKIGIFILLIFSVLIIRNRSGLVGVVVILTLILLNKYRYKINIKNLLITQVIITIIFILFLLGLFNELIEMFLQSLFYNYDINDLNSISAGRIDGYKFALEYIKQYPILGELGNELYIYATPHNYILNKWVKYGIIGSLPNVMFYLYLWFYTFKRIFRSMGKVEFTLPIMVLLFSLIVSIFEYTYPYGPGVSQLMLWFLLGQYLKKP